MILCGQIRITGSKENAFELPLVDHILPSGSVRHNLFELTLENERLPCLF